MTTPTAQMSPSDDRGFFGHPRGLSVLFFSEMWERFSFYGMRALLVLYMVNQLGYSEDERAYPVYGAYGALVYFFPVIGGWVANRWLGYRNSILLGGALMAMGHFAMAIESTIGFYGALGLLCIGNGMFKPNISSTVGRLYREGDHRRDRGFTIFYMGINMGAFAAPLICGPLGERIDWSYGFGLAGVGMVIGLIWFARGQKHLGNHAKPDDPETLYRPVLGGINRLHIISAIAFLAAPLASLALFYHDVAEKLILGISVVVLVVLINLAIRQDRIGRMRLIALMMLMVFHIMFWAGFEQAGSSFNIMTDRHMDRTIFGTEIPASIFQSVNPLFIIIFAPMFSWLWGFLDARKREPSVPVKFALGVLQLALGFFVLVWGIGTANSAGMVALVFMILTYLFHTTGEVCISPVGLSAVTKLAPKKWVGFCMGSWFLTISLAHTIAAKIASRTGGDGDALVGLQAVQEYASVFTGVAWFLVAAGVVLLALSPTIKKLMQGAE
jgi:POT family proton-dependent oligopeptide transporter